MCAQRLAVEALARGGGDNVAVAVVFLPGHGTTGAYDGWTEHGQAWRGSRGAPAVVPCHHCCPLLLCGTTPTALWCPIVACLQPSVRGGMRSLLSCRFLSSRIATFLFSSAAERVYHAGQLKYHGIAAKRTAGPGLSADELRDTY